MLSSSSPISINGVWVMTYFQVSMELIAFSVSAPPLTICHSLPQTSDATIKLGTVSNVHLTLKCLNHSANSLFKTTRASTPVSTRLYTAPMGSNIYWQQCQKLICYCYCDHSQNENECIFCVCFCFHNSLLFTTIINM